MVESERSANGNGLNGDALNGDVPNGEEALALVRERLPDVCVLDVLMPKLDGLEVVQAMRGDERTSAIPVLILTATPQDPDIARGFEAGADDHLRKPFNPRALQARVTALLRRGEG
jgi:DNA-binding response OmpR family regulator